MAGEEDLEGAPSGASKCADVTALLRATFEQEGVGLAHADAGGRLIRVNKRFCSIVGRSGEELLTSGWRELFEPVDGEPQAAWLRATNEGDAPAVFRVRLPDGAERRVALTVSSFGHAERPRSQTLLVVQEVTEFLAMLSALEASESRFRLLAENAADLITQMSLDGVCRYASPASLEILGYAPEELRGRSILELMHPDELGAARARIAEVAKDRRQIRRLTVRYLHKSGRTVYLESTASKVPSGTGDGTWEVLAVSRDVTERLRAESRLAESEARLRRILDNLQDAYSQADTEDRLTFVNRSAARMFGYADVGEMMGASAAVLYADPEERARLLEEVRRSDRVTDWVARGRKRDGTVFWASTNVQTLRDFDGTVVGTEGVIRDISERVHAEARTRLLSVMLDAAPTSIIVVDFEQRMLYANESAAGAHGVSRDELLRLRLTDILAPEQKLQASRRLEDIRAAGEATFESRHVRSDGTLYPVLVYAKVVEWQAHPAVLAVFTDMTEQKLAEERLLESEAVLRELPKITMRAQEEERRAIAHELHDGIVQDLEALKIALGTEHARAHGTTSCACVLQARGRVDTTLHAARELAVRLRPSLLDDLGLVAAIRSHANRVSIESGLEVYVSVEMEPGRLPAEVETAGFRIAQEAIANAVHHAQARGVYVRLGHELGAFVLSIHDDGAGFDVDAARRRSQASGHLGLSIMQERAAAVGGSVTIVSSPGCGTTLTMRVPLASLSRQR